MKNPRIFWILVFVVACFVQLTPAHGMIRLTKPTNVSATASSTQQINLSWSDTNSAESGYAIERSANSSSGFVQIFQTAANATSYHDVSLSPSTQYYYRLRAIGKRSSSYSVIVSAVTLAPKLTLKWLDNSTNESGFKIERKIGTTGTYVALSSVGAGVTSYIDNGLALNITYCYRVSAYNSAGSSSYTNEACGSPH